ncbi:hypothetical protein MN608_09062 [Microdochium nivale]|nr:hypothetical protein MN608_09062 [Microdochium nivale]
MPPSGTEAAKEKFNAAVEQTRAAAPGGKSQLSLPAVRLSRDTASLSQAWPYLTEAPAIADGPSDRNAGDNPKLGAFVSGLAKGDTEASRYTAQGAGGHEKPGQK